jgi:hypothetical protein
MSNHRPKAHSRREFLTDAALLGGAALAAGSLTETLAQTMPDWKRQIGLELFTVRDAMQHDYEGVLVKIALFGYKEIEPASGYNNLSPKDFRAMLDRYGLSAPSTHSGPPPGDTVEARLEGAQFMGFKYIENLGGAGGGAAAAVAAAVGPVSLRLAAVADADEADPAAAARRRKPSNARRRLSTKTARPRRNSESR